MSSHLAQSKPKFSFQDDSSSFAPSSIAPSMATITTLDEDDYRPVPDTEYLPPSYNPTSYPHPSRSGAPPPPPTYSDDKIISVQVPIGDFEDSDTETTLQPPLQTTRRRSFFDKMKPKKSVEKRIVMMTQGDYLRYWARDAQGRYIGTEPEGDGRRILRRKRMAKAAGTSNSEDTKSARVEDRFGMVEGTVGQANGYGHFVGPIAGGMGMGMGGIGGGGC